MKKPRTVVRATTTAATVRPEWGDLPKDIVDSILERLTLLADYDRFGAVCSSWRRASREPINRNRRIESSLSPSSSPLLLLPPDYNLLSPEEKPYEFTLIDVVSGNIIAKLELTSPPIPYFDLLPHCGESFYGSTHGWLIFIGSCGSLILINPFYTGGRGSGGMIRLPQLPHRNPNHISAEPVHKVVLSADPASSPNDYIVFVILGEAKEVLFIKSGEKYWKFIESCRHFTRELQADDLVFHSGLVYVVDQNRGFYGCDMQNGLVYRLCVGPPPPTPSCECYIVPPSPEDNSELLLVYMSLPDQVQARTFRVHKLVVAPGGGGGEWTYTWLEMKNQLCNDGSKAILLGQNHSICIDIKKSCCHLGFQPNSIYFMSGMYSYGRGFLDPMAQEVGIFNMEDRSTKKCHQRSLAEGVFISPPAWFFPSLPGSWKQVP